ncbi:MAG TPA: hypothetical protein DCY89_05590 [Gammaproteobacteria bacterium]|nr:hypothetical protein [Gammaproteobacteria bacterium]
MLSTELWGLTETGVNRRVRVDADGRLMTDAGGGTLNAAAFAQRTNPLRTDTGGFPTAVIAFNAANAFRVLSVVVRSSAPTAKVVRFCLNAATQAEAATQMRQDSFVGSASLLRAYTTPGGGLDFYEFSVAGGIQSLWIDSDVIAESGTVDVFLEWQ